MFFARFFWPVPAALCLLILVFILVSPYAIARPSRRVKDLTYAPAPKPQSDNRGHLLDVYAPRRPSSGCPVVVFIHGGSWNSGHKNTYTFIGRRLAKQGVVAVIINYRLAPSVEVPTMADDCAKAVQWVTQHIGEYGGDPKRIFVMGHSAGGGLAALLATDDRLFARLGMAQNPVRGVILDDAAGLDMFDYLKKMEYPNDAQYLVPFGKESGVWRDVSALYHLSAGSPPMLLYVGGRTYPSIASSSEKFYQRLQALGKPAHLRVLPGRKHVPMVTQLFFRKNIIYRDLIPFVEEGHMPKS